MRETGRVLGKEAKRHINNHFAGNTIVEKVRNGGIVIAGVGVGKALSELLPKGKIIVGMGGATAAGSEVYRRWKIRKEERRTNGEIKKQRRIFNRKRN